MHGTIERRGRKAVAKSRAQRNEGRRAAARPASTVNAALILKISPRLNRALTKLAAKSGKTKHYHVRRALERYAEDTWDVLRADEALKATRRTYSLEEVKKQLGLED